MMVEMLLGFLGLGITLVLGLYGISLKLRREVREYYKETHAAEVDALRAQIEALQLIAAPDFVEQAKARMGELEGHKEELERKLGEDRETYETEIHRLEAERLILKGALKARPLRGRATIHTGGML